MSDDSRAFKEMSLPLFDSDEVPVSANASGKQPSYIRDHRKRLRDRFISGGADALPDYEMLELVLFRAIPRRDVKPLAHALLEQFGSFNAVISAPSDQLCTVPGVGEAVICELKVVEAAAHRLARSRVARRPIVSSWDALLEYCHTAMAHRDIEQFRVFYGSPQHAYRRRGTGARHRRSRAGLSARSRQARAASQRQRADPRAQPPHSAIWITLDHIQYRINTMICGDYSSCALGAVMANWGW